MSSLRTTTCDALIVPSGSTYHWQFLVNAGAVWDAREEWRRVLNVLDPNDEVGARTEGRRSLVLGLE